MEKRSTIDSRLRATLMALKGKTNIFCFGVPKDNAFDYYKEFVVAYFDVKPNVKIYDERPVYNIYDLIFWERGSYYLIINEPDMSLPEIAKILQKELCIEAEKDTYLFAHLPYWADKDTLRRDYLLGYNRYYNENSNQYPGFKIFGNIDKAKIKIITLGGSTTDPTLCGLTSWSENLYYDLCARRKDVVILCGGFNSYTSSEELMKLLRDVLVINPDVVISYSGWNDFCGKAPTERFSNRYKRPMLSEAIEKIFRFIGDTYDHNEPIYGIRNNQDISHVFVENERKMHMLCEMYGIKHIALLQACVFSTDKEVPRSIDAEAQRMYMSGLNEWYYMIINGIAGYYANVKKEIQGLDYFYDLSNIFENIDSTEVFYDQIHVNEWGNTIIATQIYQLLVREGLV